MARVYDGMRSAGAGPEGKDGGTTYDRMVVAASDGTRPVEVPGNGFLAHAEIARDGQDLILEGPDGTVIVIEGYFLADPPPMIQAADGSVLTPDLVRSFVRHEGPLQYADNATAADESPVGAVKEVTGRATVTRTDGTTETVTVGTAIYRGDVVETDGQGAVNIVFVDESSVAVSNNARLAIDEYVFDPSSESGVSDFSMLRGMFIYTSGLIGREDPDDVHIRTPAGSIGIRGTVIAGNVDTGVVTVVEGAIVLRTHAGQEITLATQFETATFQNGAVAHSGTLNAAALGAQFSSLGAVAQGFFSTLNGDVGQSGASGNGHDGAMPTTKPEGAAVSGEDHSHNFAPVDPFSGASSSFLDVSTGVPAAALLGFTPGMSLPLTSPALLPAAETLTAPVANAPLPPPMVIDAGPLVPLPGANTPPAVTDAIFEIQENSAVGTIVGAVSATDPDAGTTLNYTIAGGNTGNTFTIDAATGVISVANNSALDFETAAPFTLSVAVSDGTVTRTAAITVQVTDIIVTTGGTSLTATADDQTLVGNALNNVLNQGTHTAISFQAGAGDDTIILNNPAFHKIDGGAGYDVLKTGIDVLDFSGLTPDRIARLEEIQMTNSSGQILTLSMANVFAILATSDTGSLTITADNSGFNTLRIDVPGTPSAPSSITPTDLEWALGADSHHTNSGYETFHFGTHELRIDANLFTGNNTVEVV